MTDEREVLIVYIGETDIQEWTQGIGKTVLMPELLVGCEELLYNDLEELTCARVETIIRGKPKAFDFSVRKTHIQDTLDKILEWALYEEKYELCERVKILNEYLEDKNNRF
tara:strand:- start:378 stop:710 length:333 start_codon:yes stop_codon:yes gene_type:complete